MPLKIKICGLKTLDDISCVNDLEIDFAGFVFAKSKRQISPETAKTLKDNLKKNIKAVGVFVDEPIENIVNLYNDGIIDIAQLHGNESPEYVRSLRAKIPAKIIKALKMKGVHSSFNACDYKGLVDFILFDSSAGSGETFEWKKLKKYKEPFFLAGGLGPENIVDALMTTRPYCVDVSSGVETDGKKDPKKVKKFVELARAHSRPWFILGGLFEHFFHTVFWL